MGVSLKPSEMTQGGLIDDVIVTWNKVDFTMFDYNGTVAPVPALHLNMETEEGETYDQYYSMGNAKDWAPSEDGKTLVSVGSASSLKMNSNGALLMGSIVNSGFPEDDIGDDISVFEGMKVHMSRAPAPKRAGIEKAERADGKKFDDTILLVDEIVEMPGAAKPAKKATAGAAKAKPKTAPAATKKPATKTAAVKEESGDDVEAAATEYIIGKLAEAGEGVQKKTLTTKAFTDLADHPLRQQIVQCIFTEDFLANGPWNYEDGVVSM